MSLKSKIFILIGLFTALVAALAMNLILIDTTTAKDIQKDNVANRAVADVYELNILATEYVHKRSPETEKEWNRKYTETQNVMEEALATFERPDSLAAIRESKEGLVVMDNTFEGLASSTSPEEEEVLMEALSSQPREIISSMEKINEASQARNIFNRRMLLFFSLLFSLFLVAIVLGATFILVNNIVYPLNEAMDAMKHVADGDFNIEVSEDILQRKDEIGEIGRVFEDMLAKLREADKVKSEFASLASHELRNPLSTIAINMELVMDLIEKEEVKNKETKNAIKDMSKATQKMQNIVNTMMSASIIEKGAVDIKKEKTDIIKLIKEEVGNISALAKDKNINIEKNYFSKDRLFAHTDPSLLRIVITNLLTNAVKYTRKRGTVTVAAYYLAKKDCIELAVQDSGYGIPEEEQDRVFEKRFRGRNIFQSDNDGAGLGLYTVKYLVEKLGGTIWFESKKEQGTTFFVRIPIEKEDVLSEDDTATVKT